MVSINGVNYSPKIKNSVLLLYASSEKIQMNELGEILTKGFNYDLAVKLFCYAVNSQGGNLEPKEIHDEVDKRIECFTELMNYVAGQLNPDDTGEPKPLKKGRTKG
jgi:hypothetical protein